MVNTAGVAQRDDYLLIMHVTTATGAVHVLSKIETICNNSSFHMQAISRHSETIKIQISINSCELCF